jgi:hypothetical protein
MPLPCKLSCDFREVICGDVAFNYEEGKASSRGLAPTTRQKGDTNGDFRAWVGSDQTRKYGTFISGCAVREDAQKFIKSAQDRVSLFLQQCIPLR